MIDWERLDKLYVEWPGDMANQLIKHYKEIRRLPDELAAAERKLAKIERYCQTFKDNWALHAAVGTEAVVSDVLATARGEEP